MRTIPIPIGVTKCVFTLIVTLPAIAACGKTEAFRQAAAPTEAGLPAPTGPHKTGRMSFHWKDAARDEVETSAADDKRELMVHLFYPADAKASGASAVYVPDADTM